LEKFRPTMLSMLRNGADAQQPLSGAAAEYLKQIRAVSKDNVETYQGKWAKSPSCAWNSKMCHI